MTTTPPVQISGLVSGLDVSSIISQLMSVESAPQTALKTRLTAEQSQVSALQQINTALASLSTAAASFQTGSTWTQLAATSSSSAVTVTASSSATPASLSLTVVQTARPAQQTFTDAAALDAMVTSGNTVTLALPDGTTQTVKVGDQTTSGPRSLRDLLTALNGVTGTDGTPLVSATAVSSGSGYRLVLSAPSGTGSLGLTNGDGTALLGGPDAALGDDGRSAVITVGGLTVTSATNTFTGVLPGTDITLAADTPANTQAQVTVEADGSSRATAVKAFVDQVNSLLQSISSQTAYGTVGSDGTSTGAGTLAGIADLRNLANQLVDTVVDGDSSLGQYGLSVDRYGQLTFDADTFTAAYAKDPQGVQSAFQDGFAMAVQSVADSASDPYDGWLTSTISGQNDEISDLTDQISAWDDRLAARQASLEQVYTNLETTLSTLQSQQSWLSSQLDSLDSSNSDS